MSDYNNGSTYGYDEFNSFEEIPLDFEQTKLPSGRQYLASPNEYPVVSRITPVISGDPITDYDSTKTAATPLGMVDAFSGAKKSKYTPARRAPVDPVVLGLTQNDLMILLFILVVIVAFMQVRLMMSLERSAWGYGSISHLGAVLPGVLPPALAGVSPLGVGLAQ
jgi:hypothetical protein